MRVIDKLCNALAVFAGLYLVAIMFAIVFQATARSFGFSGSSHVFTFSEYGLLYIVMAASPWLVRTRGHVYIEMLTAALPRRFGLVFSRLVTGLCVVICLLLVWYTGEATLKAYTRMDFDMRSLDMPKWMLLVTMPICFALMAAQFARFLFGSETFHTFEAGVHE
ncbi:MAG: TRAP transporter small permease [Gammaproteobacteria bacterium]|nr:TRAP transporter small permease [Gammaproteobacteria bacterium]